MGGRYDTYTIEDPEGRRWKVVSDGRIRCEARGERSASRLYSVEVVSPICKYGDIERVQEIVRTLRRGGAKVNSSCGIHIHVDASKHTPQTLRNVVNIMASKEDLLYKATQVMVSRENYCRKADTGFLDRLNNGRPLTMAQLEEMWYNGESRRDIHYDSSRYRGLNLHSVFQKGTIEFRLFNSTLHAGEVKSYIQLCMAISHQGLTQKSASRSRTHSDNEKYTFRTWLLRIGMSGDEYKRTRSLLMERLSGHTAFRTPADAERWKNRQREKRAEQKAALKAMKEAAEEANGEAMEDAQEPEIETAEPEEV